MARGLPAAVYTSEAFFALENERIFSMSWVFAGFAHELARPGDVAPVTVAPVTVAGRPMLLVRDAKQQIRAFHNVYRAGCERARLPRVRGRRRQHRDAGRHAVGGLPLPLDDENTTALSWACFGERGDPLAMNTPEGPELIEQGEVFDRPYEQRQRFPGDAEAVEGMGRITVHAEEHLAPSDKGVALMRRRLREQIRAVAAGERPLRVTDLAPNPVPTYGGGSVLAIPRDGDADESERFSRLAHAFMRMQFEADGLDEPERVAYVTERLRALEASGGAAGGPPDRTPA